MNDTTIPRRRPSARVLTACAGALSILLAVPSMAAATVLPAAPGNLGAVFAAANAGDVIQLAAGDYGTFSGGQKAGVVTIQPAPGAGASMEISFSNAGNINLQGVTVAGATISGGSHNITIGTSRFTNMSTVDASSMSNAGIVFDRDTFEGIDATATSYEGRLSVRGSDNAGPVGVAVTNSHFGTGGCSDGVQIVGGANGVQVGPGNEFSGLKQASCTAHVDSIQLYGSKNTQIVGNYFHDDDTIIMAPDGGESEVIADNVMVGAGYVPAVQLGSHRGSQFVHNTVKSIDVTMDHKSGESPSSNGVIRDNVFVNGSTNALVSGNCTGCTVSYNLFSSSGNASGTNAQIGAAAFVGSASPSSWAGYVLAAGSPGKANASDGADRGIRIAPAAAPAPAAPAPAPVAASKTMRGPRVSLKVPRHVTWSQLRRGLRLRVSTKVRARVSLRLDRKGAKRAVAWMTRKNPAGTRSYRLKPRHGRLGHRRAQTIILRIRVTNKAGRTTPMSVRIRVSR
jgi:hypothetical protein